MNTTRLLLALGFWGLIPFIHPDSLSAQAQEAPLSREQLAFFEAKIRPVLVDQCYSCHSTENDKLKGGLALNTRMGVLTGGDSGPAIVPGKPSESLLLKAIRYKDEGMQMPPKQKLPDAVIADFEAWVAMGAPDPRVEGAAKPMQRTEIDVEAGRAFWAYQPPKPTPPPAVRDASWPKSDVDRFILAALEAKNLKPIADADRMALLRRVYLDLIGLPPTPEQVADFLNDPSPRALETVVDSLLASPHFGERWGRHWLDVARYAESSGKTVNMNYPHAWRYRDYVIQAFNQDKPFDLFIREQLAGDLLRAKNDQDRAEKLIATGFLAVGAKPLNERNRLQFELDVVDEQIDVTTQAFLGQTAACARCHDHKFDPIPMKDYYALAGIFRSTETCYGTVRFVQSQRPSSLLTLPAGSVPSAIEPLSDRERQATEKAIADLQQTIRDNRGNAIRNLFTIAQVSLNQAKLAQFERDGTPKLQAMGARERFRATDSPVYQRGEPDRPGEVVSRGVLQVVSTEMPKIGRSSSGRKELADWIASTNNPLTARVYVNRVWQHLFGRGIVSTPDNFGTTGALPSHPALLDHLALTFMAEGWSTKALIRKLVLSRTYQLSAQNNPVNYEADPENTLCWRMTPGRQDAEVIRDAMLAIGGNLKTEAKLGSPVARAGEGPSQRPRFGPAINTDANDTHRSVYLPIVRDNLPEVLSLFDAADPNMIVGERTNTSVPAQALFMLNNPFVIRQSSLAAERVLASGTTTSDRVRHAYRLFYAREATDQEVLAGEEFVKKYPTSQAPARAARFGAPRFGRANSNSEKETWAAFCQALFASAEFLMRN